MPFEINDGRTPPTVMFTMSPMPRSTGLGFERNSPQNHSHNRFKDVSNLKVNQRRSRSFTPVKSALYLHSPELSPIDTMNNRQCSPEVFTKVTSDSSVLEKSLTPGDYKVLEKSLTPVEFKVPTPIFYKTNEDNTPTRPVDIQSEELNQTQSLDKSASHGYLNHKLEVRLILKNAGMQKYIEAFDKEEMDVGRFLSLCEEDLLQFGVERKVDRKVIFSIISDLNSN